MRVLENLEQIDDGGLLVFRCAHCKAVIGPADEDYKNHAAHYDEDINYGEPSVRHVKSSAFVLRSFVCSTCGVLFEVDMVLDTDKPFRSVQLDATAR